MNYDVYFENGTVVQVFPMPPDGVYENREIIYGADEIYSDGVLYDLNDIHSIYSIPVPTFSFTSENEISEDLGVTGFLDYALRMRAGRHWEAGRYDLAIACLEKSTVIMAKSSIMWPQKDFYRIVNFLYDLGYITRARRWKDWIESNVPGTDEIISDNFKNTLEGCEHLGTNLVEVGDIGGCCEVCAKYRKRIYRIGGNDFRFPKFPNDFHFACGLSMSPYIWGISEPSFDCRNVIKYSNRPYIDDRTLQEKQNYSERLKYIANEKASYLRAPDPNRTAYYLIKKYLPVSAPKTMSGYSRMRNTNSKNYQALMRAAAERGISIPVDTSDLFELEQRNIFELSESVPLPETTEQRQTGVKSYNYNRFDYSEPKKEKRGLSRYPLGVRILLRLSLGVLCAFLALIFLALILDDNSPQYMSIAESRILYDQPLMKATFIGLNEAVSGKIGIVIDLENKTNISGRIVLNELTVNDYDFEISDEQSISITPGGNVVATWTINFSYIGVKTADELRSVLFSIKMTDAETGAEVVQTARYQILPPP